MISIRKPTTARREALLERMSGVPSTFHEHLGVTRNGDYPRGHNIDRNTQSLGAGRGVYERAVATLRAWKMYPSGWTEIYPANTPIVPDAMFGSVQNLAHK